MKRTLIKDTIKTTGKSAKVCGWVNIERSHGKIIFIDLRDISGVIQIVFTPDKKEVYELAKKLRGEWVVEITGKINKRPSKMVNPKIETGDIEMEATDLKVLSRAKTIPFSIEDDGREIGEEIRMKYRYLDIRRNRVRNNLLMRNKIIRFIRDYLDKEGFIEIETPILSKSTPEGARDFIVPSRNNPGKFYALPQAPQQYKQLLMVAGLEKYFQIARCFRDEDPRGDRQAEFTQLDLEMSFVEKEDVMQVTESLLIGLVESLFPNKKIQDIPFPRISYKEAMKKYKTDKPDLRKDKKNKDILSFCWVVDFPFFEKGDDKKWTFTHNPFSSPDSKYMEDLINKKNIENILTTQYDIVLNGWEVGGGSIRNHDPKALRSVFEIIGYKEEEINNNFGHILEAFEYGTPPHGGIAPGLDRLVMILQDELNIREVIAFPKTGDNRDLMMNAPSEVSEKQLKELHIKTDIKEKK